MNKTVMITGASSGIGAECAKAFGSAGYNLIITGRRMERLQELKKQVEEDHVVEVLALKLDVRDREQVNQAIEGLEGHWRNIDILVNNAGLALGLEMIQEGHHDDWNQMIDTNIKGLLYVSRAVIPLMIERREGHIINIGSIAGREVYPKGNVYCATKHAVDALSQGMRIDLVQHGIKVSQVSPGATDTEFSKVRFHGDEKRAKDVYQGYHPLSGADVAHVVLFVASLPGHVNVNDLLLMPTAQASATVFHKK
jgi:3-hydroxy acid dehydrogenase / malonic semialdehyde reductase